MLYLFDDEEKHILDGLEFHHGEARTRTASGREAYISHCVDLREWAKYIEQGESYSPKRPRFILYVEDERKKYGLLKTVYRELLRL